MANMDYRFGLKPVRSFIGGANDIKVHPYYVPDTYATALYIGDPVVVTGTSNTTLVNNKYKPGTLPEINKATAGATNVISGVIVGFVKPTMSSSDLSKVYNRASTECIVMVCDDPYAVFEVQADSANAVAATDIRANANVVYTHSGDTVYGLSGVELDTASMAADVTYQLTILGLVNREDNALGTNAKLEVMINLHSFKAAVIGV
jgi:hypothetical protein